MLQDNNDNTPTFSSTAYTFDVTCNVAGSQIGKESHIFVNWIMFNVGVAIWCGSNRATNQAYSLNERVSTTFLTGESQITKRFCRPYIYRQMKSCV
ncbi:hypothetical protein DPMN_046950 [Dreissena polymorpha]|uniref:Uncharacterized protein n=1 Tax=Dreissena polymorpha TaxID=45954 RepID=A0A9D4D8U1_DREPO|nr:hypothetical protein DPMN_046950 [Dreissena polymorpha]